MNAGNLRSVTLTVLVKTEASLAVEMTLMEAAQNMFDGWPNVFDAWAMPARELNAEERQVVSDSLDTEVE